MASKTKLDQLVEQAVDLVVELQDLEGNRKLSYPAYLAAALKIAGCDRKRIAVVENLIKKSPGTENLQAFLRRYSKMISESNFPRPNENTNRLLRIYGREELLPEANALGVKPAELQALAVCVCFDHYGDQVFGRVSDWHAHEKKTTEVRQRLDSLQEEMRSACTSVDLTYIDSYPDVLPSERERGLCKVSFRRAEGIGPHHGDWPRELVAACAKAPKTKRERMKAA